MTRIYWLLIAVLALAATHTIAFRSGKQNCEAAHTKAVTDQKVKDAERIAGIVKSDTRREKRDAAKIVLIKESKDACIDQRMPADIIDVLGGVQQRDSGPTQPGTPETLSTSTTPG
jgi:hypothetical protein